MREYDPKSRLTAGSFIVHALQGALIGSGAILPGVSGGVLCVIFGVYRPMMAVLSDPFRKLKDYWRLMLPIGVGWIVGFFVFARLIEMLFALSGNVALWLFIGLIAGTVPSLFREAGEKGRTVGGWSALAVSMILVYALFAGLSGSSGVSITPNYFWFFFCGVLWGVSVVIPGMTSTSILIFLGLFEPMTSGIAAFDMGVVVPMFAGIIVTVLLLAKAVNKLFEKHYTVAYHAVIGFTFASTMAIIPTAYSSAGELALCAAVFAAGYAGAYFMDKLGVD